MAREILYWPVALTPFYPRVSGFGQSLPNVIDRQQPGKGAALQRTLQDAIFRSVSGEYLFYEDTLDNLFDFMDVAGGRSFYLPFPQPNDRRFIPEKWWYGRFSISGDSAVETQSLTPDLSSVRLAFDFWIKVPGVVPPFEAKGCGNG